MHSAYYVDERVYKLKHVQHLIKINSIITSEVLAHLSKDLDICFNLFKLPDLSASHNQGFPDQCIIESFIFIVTLGDRFVKMYECVHSVVNDLYVPYKHSSLHQCVHSLLQQCGCLYEVKLAVF